MKYLPLGILSASTLFAYTAEVENAEVKLQINDAIKSFQANQTVSLAGNDVVYFLEGEGRVVIQGEGYSKQLSKNTKSCKQLPSTKQEGNAVTTYATNTKNSVLALVSTSTEKTISGTSRKSIGSEVQEEQIFVISSKDTFVSLENNQWGPLPVKLEILSKEGKVIDQMENSDELVTSFIIPAKRFHDGDSIKVTNAFGDVLLSSNIKMK